MFGICHDDWAAMCNAYFNQKGLNKYYLQWFPFSRLSEKEKDAIISEEYFNRYIKNGAGIFFKDFLFVSENYLQKADGSFRDSTLVSPMLYLVLQCIGKRISTLFKPTRPNDISVFYAGNYQLNRVYYKQDYDEFYKEINLLSEDFNLFIKTDISNFFANVNIATLIKMIDDNINYPDIQISQQHLILYKEILYHCGKGKFPLLENGVASSYLSTVIYLDVIDKILYDYLSTLHKEISHLKMIR